MNACCSIIKFFVVLMNLAFWLIGLSIVALTIWMLLDPAFMITLAQEQQNYQYALYVLLGLGIVLIIMALCGCCGAFRESRSMLVWFFCCMLIVITAEIAAGVWAYANSNKLESFVKANMKHTIQHEYSKIPARTEVIDIIQRNFECCGYDAPSDWSATAYNKKEGSLDFSIKSQSNSQNTMFELPASCCMNGTMREECDKARKNLLAKVPGPNIYKKGCIEQIASAVKSHAEEILIGALIIISVQLFGILFISCLCCAVRRSKDDECKD